MSDGNKIRHNLALAYANNKLQIALQRGERPQGLDLNDPAQAFLRTGFLVQRLSGATNQS